MENKFEWRNPFLQYKG